MDCQNRRTIDLIAGCAFVDHAWCLACLVYHPGLSGGFLFDDFANLPPLGEFGPVDNTARPYGATLLQASPIPPAGHACSAQLLDRCSQELARRPIFVQAYTSVLLHLLNGALLCWLLLKLGRALGKPERQTMFAAALGAACWLLHPLFVSTTLYIVPARNNTVDHFRSCRPAGFRSQPKPDSARPSCRSVPGGVIRRRVHPISRALQGRSNGALLPLLAWIVDCYCVGTISAADSSAHPTGFRSDALGRIDHAEHLVVHLPRQSGLRWFCPRHFSKPPMDLGRTLADRGACSGRLPSPELLAATADYHRLIQ